MIIERPKKTSIITANSLRIFGSKWNNRTSAEMLSVKIVKLSIMPSVIPRGRLWDVLPTEAERIIGKSGQIQGARIVTSPDINAKISKSAISTNLV